MAHYNRVPWTGFKDVLSASIYNADVDAQACIYVPARSVMPMPPVRVGTA